MRRPVLVTKQPAGFSTTELVVVIGILGVLASILFPALQDARKKAQITQCTSNLRQLMQAVTMYDLEFDRNSEAFPDRITHLYDLDYVRNPNLFICPADPTRGIGPSLKPGFPVDNKSAWHETAGVQSADSWHEGYGRPLREQNCSYLYEFSNRRCEGWTGDVDDGSTVEWSGNYEQFCSNFLTGWVDTDYYYSDFDFFDEYSEDAGDNMTVIHPPDPRTVDRDRNGIVTWQEAKYSQMLFGDIYTTGLYAAGEKGIPEDWGKYTPTELDPYFAISFGDAPRQRGYPRTWIPLLRCFWHCNPKQIDEDNFYAPEHVLNLAVEGNYFHSVPGWEQTAWKYGRTRWDTDGFEYDPTSGDDE